MPTDDRPTPSSDLPAGLSRPARSALAAAGVTRIEQLAQWREADVLQLHGIGPKSIPLLRQGLAEQDLTFRGE